MKLATLDRFRLKLLRTQIQWFVVVVFVVLFVGLFFRASNVSNPISKIQSTNLVWHVRITDIEKLDPSNWCLR